MDDRLSLAFLLHDVARRFRARFDQRARGLGVTRQQWRVLLNLAQQPAPTQAELADVLEVERITLCRMIDRLAEAGLVERRGDPADRRVWRIHLTQGAEAVVTQLAKIARELEEEAMESLAAPEREALRATLIQVRDALDAPGSERRTATA